MFTFKVNNKPIPVLRGSMVEDIQNFYFYVELDTYAYIPLLSEVEMSGKNSTTLIVLQGVYQETFYRYTLVSKEQFDSFSMTTKPYTGNSTVKGLLSHLGVKHIITDDSSESWWMLPSLNYKGLITDLNKWSVIPNGGAPRFYLDFSGSIRYIDLVKSYYDKPVSLKGDVSTDISDIEWMLTVPGNVKIIHQDINDSITEEVSLNPDLLWFKVYVNDHTTKSIDSFKQAFVNEYNYRSLSSRTIMLSRVYHAPLRLGQCVSVNDKTTGIITGITIPVTVGEESSNASVKVSCPGLSEQK